MRRQMKWKLFTEYLLNKKFVAERIPLAIAKFRRVKKAFRKLIQLFREYKKRKSILNKEEEKPQPEICKFEHLEKLVSPKVMPNN
jgi:hypothetical protein